MLVESRAVKDELPTGCRPSGRFAEPLDFDRVALESSQNALQTALLVHVFLNVRGERLESGPGFGDATA